MTKRIVSALLAAAVAFSAFNISVAAKEMTNANLEIVVPAYEIASNPESTLIISGTTASCKSTVTGKSVKSISAEQTLEKFWGLWIWNEVDNANWTKVVNSSTITMSNKKYNLESGTYRLKTVFTLTATNGETETITVYSGEVKL